MSRSGGILIEVMLAMAIFVAAAAFILSATRNVFSGFDRSMRQQQAADLARSKMAELDAGLISIMDLRGGELRRIGSIESFAEGDRTGAGALQWITEVSTQRSEYRNLTLVELTVREDSNATDAAEFVVRQLIQLREADAEDYEVDELLEGLVP